MAPGQRRHARTRNARGPALPAAAGLLALALMLVLTADALDRYARARARRTAHSVAAYLAIVTGAARAGKPSSVPARLLAQARALATLPGFGGGVVEVYHGTAPLIQATAPPLTPELYGTLHCGSGERWEDGRAVVAFRLRSDSPVAGAVAVSRLPGSPRHLSPLLLLTAFAMLLFGGLALRDAGKLALARYGLAALACAAAAGWHVRGAARGSVDGWLADARLLVQEAVARRPRGRVPLSELARIVPGATLARGEAAPDAPRRVRSLDGPTAAVMAVRLSEWRWLEIRAVPAQPPSGSLPLILALLSTIGPAALLLSRWRIGGRRRVKPRRGRWRMLRVLLMRGA